MKQLQARCALQCIGCGAEKLLPGESTTQTHHHGGMRQIGRRISAYGINLPTQRVARDRVFGPTFGQHYAQPSGFFGEQALWGTFALHQVQGKVRCFDARRRFEHSIKLRFVAYALHVGQRTQPCNACIVEKTHPSAPVRPKQIRDPGACGLWRGVRSAQHGRHGFSCGPGSRGYGHV
ncbi:MAG: hypothetical protein RI959_946 [Pseudomonadota bacterium]